MATRSFVEGIGWLAQIGLFVMLGLLAEPGRAAVVARLARARGRRDPHLRRPAAVGRGVRGVVQASRAASSCSSAGPVCAAPCRSSWRRSRWPPTCRARATCSTSCSSPSSSTRLLQAAPLARLAALCGVLTDDARDVEVEAAPLERVSADLLQIRVPRGSKLAGVEIGELRLPAGRLGLAGRPRRQDVRAAPHGPPRGPRRPADRGGAPRARGRPSSDCAPSAATAAWPAGAGRTRPRAARRLARTSSRRSAATMLRAGLPLSLVKSSPITITTPSSTVMSGAAYVTLSWNCAATSLTRGSLGSSVRIATRRGLGGAGAVADLSAEEAVALQVDVTRLASPDALLRVEDVDRDEVAGRACSPAATVCGVHVGAARRLGRLGESASGTR